MRIDKDQFNILKSKINDSAIRRGLDLIEFKIIAHGKSWIIRAIVDYPLGGVTIDECSSLNREIISLVEEDSFGGNFIVEVNSPGLDRLLKEKNDFLRVGANTVMIWLKEPFQGKSYLEAVICNVEDNAIEFRIKEEVFQIPLSNIKAAKQKIY